MGGLHWGCDVCFGAFSWGVRCCNTGGRGSKGLQEVPGVVGDAETVAGDAISDLMCFNFPIFVWGW